MGYTFTIAETVTEGSSSATGKVAFSAAGYCELYNVSVRTFVSGETITGGTSAKTATQSGGETLEDVIVTNSDQTTRYTQGTDYSIDADAGYIRELAATSTITSHAVEVSVDHVAISREYLWGQVRRQYHEEIHLHQRQGRPGTMAALHIPHGADRPQRGHQPDRRGNAVLNITGSALADISRASGQEYYKVEMPAQE